MLASDEQNYLTSINSISDILVKNGNNLVKTGCKVLMIMSLKFLHKLGIIVFTLLFVY